MVSRRWIYNYPAPARKRSELWHFVGAMVLTVLIALAALWYVPWCYRVLP